MNQEEIQNHIYELERLDVQLEQKISSAYEISNEIKYKNQRKEVLKEIERLEDLYEECESR